ncbi:MAG: hypothetical protein IT303_01195 [Dehalococcoidia bacterium]|nr:hypothetical protein [Dehalococcoidia bacterium]
MHPCAICRFLGMEPRYTTNVVGLRTRIEELHSHPGRTSLEGFDIEHVMLPACPEHVVEVYRGRVDGVAMAWRLPEPAFAPRRD